MKLSENHLDRTWAEERIEAYADELLSRAERKRFENMLAADDELVRQVDIARSIRRALHDTSLPSCPPSVYEPVLEMARRSSEVPSRFDLIEWLRALGETRLTPARVIVVTSLLLAAVLTTVTMRNQTRLQPAPSAAEVQEALEEVKLALSYVALAGRETGSTIRHRAVDESIIYPVVRAIDRAEIGSPDRTQGSHEDTSTSDGTTRGES